MARFIDKPEKPDDDPVKSKALQVRNNTKNALGSVLPQKPASARPNERLPNASIIYGAAGGVLLVFGAYVLISAHEWLTGGLILVIGGTLICYALYFMRYR